MSKNREITEESVISWFAEADQEQLEEDRRTHVLFDENYIETNHVLEAESSDHARIIKRLDSQWQYKPTEIRRQ
jgi:hypothetical protein